MFIWHLVRTGYVDYDEPREGVVLASSESEARSYMAEEHGEYHDVPSTVWERGADVGYVVAAQLGQASPGLTPGIVTVSVR